MDMSRYIVVDRAAFQLALNALRRDANEGKVVRGEIADELANVPEQPANPLLLSELIDQCREAVAYWEPLRPFIKAYDAQQGGSDLPNELETADFVCEECNKLCPADAMAEQSNGDKLVCINCVPMVTPDTQKPSEIERLTLELQNQRELTQHWRSQALSAKLNNDWKEAVVNECVVAEIGWTDDPHQSIKSLIDWHVSVALDPRVSEAARTLIEQGKKSNSDPKIDLFQIFEAGWKFHTQTQGHVFDGRDLARLTTSHFWPPMLENLHEGLDLHVCQAVSSAIVLVKQEIKRRLDKLSASIRVVDSEPEPEKIADFLG